MIKLKRAYDPVSPTDGTRLLVERLWPRGVSKDKLKLDGWIREVAPTTELRKWFGHDPKRWKEFKSLYFKELMGKKEMLDNFLGKIKHKRFTLLYAAKDTKHNNAVCLKEFLEKFHNL